MGWPLGRIAAGPSARETHQAWPLLLHPLRVRIQAAVLCSLLKDHQCTGSRFVCPPQAPGLGLGPRPHPKACRREQLLTPPLRLASKLFALASHSRQFLLQRRSVTEPYCVMYIRIFFHIMKRVILLLLKSAKE